MFRKIILVTALLATAISVPASAAARTRATEVSEVPIAMDFLAARGRLDFDAAASLLDEDAVLDLPYVNDGLIVRRQADILQFFRRSMSKSVSGIVYKLDQAYPSPKAGARLTAPSRGERPTSASRPNLVVRRAKSVACKLPFIWCSNLLTPGMAQSRQQLK